MRHKRLIGRATPKYLVEIDRSDIRRYALAIGASDPIHFDSAAAKKAGYDDVVAPASMIATLGRYQDLVTLFEVNPKNVLHSEQTIDLRRPLLAGDAIKVMSVVTDVHERPIGSSTTGFITIEDQGQDNKGKPLFISRRVLAVRQGFPRR